MKIIEMPNYRDELERAYSGTRKCSYCFCVFEMEGLQDVQLKFSPRGYIEGVTCQCPNPACGYKHVDTVTNRNLLNTLAEYFKVPENV